MSTDRTRFTLAWSSAALAPAAANLHDTTAFRYNVLVHGFDTALIAGDDRGGDAFGALTFTRVLGQAWELHGEAAWREHEAVLLGGKYTTRLRHHFHRRVLYSAQHPVLSGYVVSPLLPGASTMCFSTPERIASASCPAGKQWDLSAGGRQSQRPQLYRHLRRQSKIRQPLFFLSAPANPGRQQHIGLRRNALLHSHFHRSPLPAMNNETSTQRSAISR
jgi:hypothetical protein